MDNFIYCYLSPFLVGLLTVVAIVVGIIAIIALLYYAGKGLEKGYDYTLKGYPTVKRTLSSVSDWITNGLLVVFIIMFGATIAHLFWTMGIDIHKRIFCK